MPDFIPQNEGQLILWLGNFQNKFTTTHAATLGYTPAQITAISDSCTALVTALNAVEAAKTALRNAVESKDTVKFDSLGFLRTEIRKIKTNDAFTDAMGKDLGIIGSPEDMDAESMKPKLSGEAFPGYVRLKFTKKGLDGVNIYTRLKGQSQWTFLARDTVSPYDDTRPLSQTGVPETREYMCIGVIDDTEVGQQSDIVTVVFGG
jgi:hypothetical protein